MKNTLNNGDFKELLRVISPSRLFSIQQQEETFEEDQTPFADGAAKVLKHVIRLIEQGRYLPVIVRTGGAVQTRYFGDIEEEAEAAEAFISLIEQYFRPPMRLKYDVSASMRQNQGATDGLAGPEPNERVV